MTLACHELTPRKSDSWAPFVEALREARLPTEDLTEPNQVFFAFRDADRALIGFGGYLLADRVALLRSIVVVPSQRRRGTGAAILAQLLSRAVGGADTAWLLTTGAEGFFARQAFVRKERAEAPPAIAAARQFTSICPASAVLMCRPLR
jgi:N-acetylglutamate synthase-like GNAT family acetyltransferase